MTELLRSLFVENVFAPLFIIAAVASLIVLAALVFEFLFG
jgi:hypothetical protein